MLHQRQATRPKIQGQTKKCGHEELFHEARSSSIHKERICCEFTSIHNKSFRSTILQQSIATNHTIILNSLQRALCVGVAFTSSRNQCLSAGLPSVMLLLANIKLGMHCQKMHMSIYCCLQCTLTSVMFCIYA